MSAPITPQYLLEGAVYALEQCGLLLRDANLLYRSGSYATAVALAEFAQEELGRWKILLDLRKRVVAGQSVTVEEIQSRCEGHVTKQQAGMRSITMMADRDSVLGKTVSEMNSEPGSQGWKKARAQLEKLDKQKKKRLPDDRHRQRMSALYVDPLPGQQWNRPVEEISQTVAQRIIQDAATDYAVAYSQDYTDLTIRIKDEDPELYAALNQWSDRPRLPAPERPD
jgi:AbiV family abortive infection protein